MLLLLLQLLLLLLLTSEADQGVFQVVFIAFKSIELVCELLDSCTLGPGFFEHVLEDLVELIEFSRDVLETEDFVLIPAEVKVVWVDGIQVERRLFLRENY